LEERLDFLGPLNLFVKPWFQDLNPCNEYQNKYNVGDTIELEHSLAVPQV
jgi:hypothetical protein